LQLVMCAGNREGVGDGRPGSQQGRRGEADDSETEAGDQQLDETHRAEHGSVYRTGS